MKKTTVASLVLAAAVSATGGLSPAFATDTEVVPDAARQPEAEGFSMPPEMIRKLSPEQIVSVLREREARRATFAGRPPNLAGGLLFFGALIAMVLLAQVFATRRERIRQETLRAMVEKGIEIPPGLVGDSARSSSDLRRGLVLVGAGLGVSLVFTLVHLNGPMGSGLWSIGLVPILMGGGYLFAWRVETRNPSDRA